MELEGGEQQMFHDGGGEHKRGFIFIIENTGFKSSTQNMVFYRHFYFSNNIFMADNMIKTQIVSNNTFCFYKKI